MSLFICDECGSVENTALSKYHVRRFNGAPPLCSACDPTIGEWHGAFPQEPWNGERQVLNPPDGNTCERCGNGPYHGGECRVCRWNPEAQGFAPTRTPAS